MQKCKEPKDPTNSEVNPEILFALKQARAMALRKVTRQESSSQDLQSREKVIEYEPSVSVLAFYE
jgi:hypothetical protein